MYGLGYVPDDQDDRDREYAVSSDHLPLAAPGSYDARHLFGDPFNQNGHNSCVGQGIAKGVYGAHVKAGHVDPPNICRFLVWAHVRGPLRLSANVGGQIRTGFKKMNAEGFCKEEYWPHDHDTGPEASFRRKPPRNARRMAYDQSEKQQLTVYRRVYESGSDRVERLKACVANDLLPVFGTDVDGDFANNRFDPSVAIDPPTGNIVGGHCMVVVGYLPGDVFIIGNSWSKRWGDGGFCLFSADYITSGLTRDIWVVEKAPWFTG
jgi:hypothetical protein